MQTTTYNCGPATLATVLNNLGINVTEQELATLAGTDENGTTMYGLVQAAKAKGLNAVGMKISVNELKKNNIVFITVNGGPHYSVVREVTADKVLLADPSLGNIEMTKEKFAEVYSGNALVVSDPNAPSQDVSNSTQTTGTAEQTSNVTDTNSTNIQPENKNLTKEEMQKIQGKGLRWSYRWCGWYPVRVRAYYGFNMARCLWGWDVDGFKNYGDRYMNWYRCVGYRYAA